MRILLINQAFVSPSEPGHTRHYELARFMQQTGDELIIIASDINYQTGRRVIEHRGIFVVQEIQGISIFRASMLPALHRSFSWRILSFISFMFSSVWTSLHTKKVDIVMGTTPPIFQAAAAWFVAFLSRKPFLLEVRDLWPEFAIDMGVLKNPILIGISRWLEAFLYRNARMILVNSPAYADYLISKQVPPEKITFIPYGADIDMFTPEIDGRGFRSALGLEDKFIIMYSGALGLANDLTTVLHAADRLRDLPDIHFVFLGDGKERESLEQEAERLRLENVTFAGTFSKDRMPQAVAAADAGLAILKNIKMFNTTYPNKVFDYMSAGRPTILVIDGVIRQIIEDADGGIFVPPGDDEALAQAVLKLNADRVRARQMGANARHYIVEHFDRRRHMSETIRQMRSLIET